MTRSRRIQITVDKSTKDIVRLMAKQEGVSISSKALELVKLALDIEEDSFLGTEIEKRMTYVREARKAKPS